jgi:hypothetical protein
MESLYDEREDEEDGGADEELGTVDSYSDDENDDDDGGGSDDREEDKEEEAEVEEEEESKFGENFIVEHWPQYVTAQLELYGFKFPPIYGSLKIQPRGKAYLHRNTSLLGASDDFEVDDNESTNYDEDYDGTHGESNREISFGHVLMPLMSLLF